MGRCTRETCTMDGITAQSHTHPNTLSHNPVPVRPCTAHERPPHAVQCTHAIHAMQRRPVAATPRPHTCHKHGHDAARATKILRNFFADAAAREHTSTRRAGSWKSVLYVTDVRNLPNAASMTGMRNTAVRTSDENVVAWWDGCRGSEISSRYVKCGSTPRLGSVPGFIDALYSWQSTHNTPKQRRQGRTWRGTRGAGGPHGQVKR